jgi:hypothetical protein
MRTTPYHTLADGGATDRRVNKEVVLMRHENGTPKNRRRLVAISTMLAVVLVGVVLGPPSWGQEGRSTGSATTSSPWG